MRITVANRACLALAFLACTLIAPPAAAADFEKQFDVTPGGTLDIELRSGGSVDIEGWDKSEVTIEADFGYNDPEDYVFEAEPTSRGIEIYSKSRRHLDRNQLDVTIKCPREFNVKVRSAGGSFAFTSLKGDIRGSSGGGTIDLRDIEGTVKLTTGGGEVEVLDSRVDGEVTTGGGSVRVENVVGDFDARSGGGSVVFSNVKTPGREYPEGEVHIRSGGGRIDVDDAPEGADVATGGGDIRIRSARKFVNAKTGGGDILVRSASGSVELTTGAGDIEITVEKDTDYEDGDILLLTGMGDVYLTVPESMSMDVDIELAYTKRGHNRYEIESDFQIAREETDEWEYDHGSPRKYIYGTASLNGGKNRIKIRTTNGNVHLNKGR